MQIPSKVRIGGIDYKVKHIPAPTSSDGALCYGTFDPEHSVIELNSEKGLSHDRMCQTLMHEILHGVMFHYNLTPEDEEVIVTTMARGIFQVIKDNPKIFQEVKNGNLCKGKA